jgi:hypothetical protein
LAGSGWQYEGRFGAFLGTVIGPHHFITAKHLGQVSDKFVFHDTAHEVIHSFPDPKSDLQILEVEGTLPDQAPLYLRQDEVGKHLVVIGRGTQRGTPRIIDGELRGWNYGETDSVQRWGENRVAGIVAGMLCVLFEKGGLPEESHLSAGDSGGGVFLNDDGAWKLAGINSDVDKFASGPDGGGGYTAALFDQRGSYRDDGTLVRGDSPVPSGFYAVRISQRIGWIRSVIRKPESNKSDR